MGVLNVTPDSFSDGGLYADIETAVVRAAEMIEEGVDIIDIGGESTRPATFRDHSPLSAEEELRRVIPVIERVARAYPAVPISIDTYKGDVAQAALDAGASIVNDISGLAADPAMIPLIAARGVPAIVMHLPGEPRNIPDHIAYDDVVGDIAAYLKRQTDQALAAGVPAENLIVDPGIGFGKDPDQNLTLIRRLRELTSLGFPILVGPSRKRFLGRATGATDPADRDHATTAAVAVCIVNGAAIIRVHNVRAGVHAARTVDAILHGLPS